MMEAFQDQMSGNHCFGCGPENEKGLQIKSFWKDDSKQVAICRYMPKPEHMAGPTHILNGGIIATLIDCHGICTAAADAYVQEGKIMDDEKIWYVTGSFNLKYHKPTPIGREVYLEADISERKGVKSVVQCRLYSEGPDGPLCAEAELVAIRVPLSWLESI
jgi:acyl-coenzyme A thioesterase PaaI-like protein